MIDLNLKFEVIPSRRYQHTSGATASLTGACPWTSEADRPNWTVVDCGWTVRNPHTGQIGVGRKPWATREEAEDFAATRYPSRIAFGD